MVLQEKWPIIQNFQPCVQMSIFNQATFKEKNRKNIIQDLILSYLFLLIYLEEYKIKIFINNIGK